MKVGKKIFVGSLILLLATTPLIASAGINENKQSPSMNINNWNSLGSVSIRHQPMLYYYSEHHGMDIFYSPPPDHPTFDYYFSELENGTVILNFTLAFEHYLNYPGPRYIAARFFPNNFRFTWIDRFWIGNGHDPDIFSIEEKIPCISSEVATFNITVGGKYLTTNGNDTTLQFWLWGLPGITPIIFIQNLIHDWAPDIGHNFLLPFCSPLEYIPITIHPYLYNETQV